MSSSRIRARSSSSHNSQSLSNISSSNNNVVFSRLAFVVPILRFFGPDDALQVIQLRSLNTCFQEAVEEGHIDDVVWEPIVKADEIDFGPGKGVETFFLKLFLSKRDPSWALQFLIDRGFDVDEQRFSRIVIVRYDGHLDTLPDESSLLDALFHLGSVGGVRWLLSTYPGGGGALKVQHELNGQAIQVRVPPLLFSALHGKWDIFDALLDADVQDEVALEFFDAANDLVPQTALHAAVRCATPAVVQRLLAGPSVEIIDHATVVEWETREAVTPLSDAVARVALAGTDEDHRRDAMAIVKMLLDAEAKPNATGGVDSDGQTHEDKELYQLLLAHGAELNVDGRVTHSFKSCSSEPPCVLQETYMPPLAVPLYFSPEHDRGATIPGRISDSKLQWINRLIDDGARWPKFVDEKVPSPQLCAAATGNIGLLRRLVREAGCDINHEFAPWGDHQSEFSQAVTPLSIAIRRGRFHMVKALVEEFGCELKYPEAPFFTDCSFLEWANNAGRYFRSLADLECGEAKRVRVAADIFENQQGREFEETMKELQDPGGSDDTSTVSAWLSKLHVPEIVRADWRSTLLSGKDALFLIQVYVFAPAGSRLEIWSYLRGKLMAERAEEKAASVSN